jgi:hypothetical protein
MRGVGMIQLHSSHASTRAWRIRILAGNIITSKRPASAWRRQSIRCLFVHDVSDKPRVAALSPDQDVVRHPVLEEMGHRGSNICLDGEGNGTTDASINVTRKLSVRSLNSLFHLDAGAGIGYGPCHDFCYHTESTLDWTHLSVLQDERELVAGLVAANL